MGIGGKKRWRISFYRSSSRPQKKLPSEFICPISSSLMAEPVIVSSGQTFERACAQACRDLGFVPLLSDGSRPEFSALIPNLALKSTIVNWCHLSGLQLPNPLESHTAIELVRALMEAEKGKEEEGEPEKTQKGIHEKEALFKEAENRKVDESEIEKTQKGIHEKTPLSKETTMGSDVEVETEKTQKGFHEKGPILRKMEKRKDEEGEAEETQKEKELLLRGVSETPDRKFLYAATEVNRRLNHFCDSSSEDSVLATPLPLATKPSCYSSCSSDSTQKEDVEEEELEEIISKLKSSEIFEQEEAVIRLRSITRNCPENRVPLCTSRLLTALRPMLASKNSSVLTNAAAVLVNLSLEKPNKVKIVRAGTIPPLINVLKSGLPEAQEHAAGALFSLALEDGNRMAIGVLGALPPLLHMLQSKSERGRQDAALALYHLTLVQSNCSKLVKLGAIPALLALARGGELACRVLIIICNLASGLEGRIALIDADTVEVFIEMLKREDLEGSVRENCIAALFALSQSSLRFKGSAKAAGAVEVLMEAAEKGSERARQKVKRMLMLLKEKEEVEVVAGGPGAEVDNGGVGDEGERVSDSVVGEIRQWQQQQRYHLHKGKNIMGAYSTEF